MENREFVPCCPYCGSVNLISIDWGFAEWECETCRNNFRSPARKYTNDNLKFQKEKLRKNTLTDKIFELFFKIIKILLILLLIFCLISVILFFGVRFYQIFILPFL